MYFYLVFMAIRFAAGALSLWLALCRSNDGESRATGLPFMFLLDSPYSFFGAKWLRHTLSLMPFVYMLARLG